MALETFTNQIRPTLASAIATTGATSMTLSSVTGLPSTGNCRVLIDGEIIIVTLNGTTTVTIARGAEGTTAATHSSGTTVYFILSAGALNQSRAEAFGYGPYSSRGANGQIGRWYKDSDGRTMARDNGTTWDNFALAPFAVTPPVMTDFARIGYAVTGVFGQSFDIISKGAGQYIQYTVANAGTEQIGGWYRAVNASTSVAWTATVGISQNLSHQQLAHAGLFLYQTSGTKFTSFGCRYNQGIPQCQSYNFTCNGSAGPAATAFITTNFATTNYHQDSMKFYRMQYLPSESTLYIMFYESVDGINWNWVANQSLSSMNSMTFPNFVGFYANFFTSALHNSNYPGFDVFHWTYTEP